jgi:hypothetical protein
MDLRSWVPVPAGRVPSWNPGMWTCCTGPGTNELNQIRDLFLAFENLHFATLVGKKGLHIFVKMPKLKGKSMQCLFFSFFSFFAVQIWQNKIISS